MPLCPDTKAGLKSLDITRLDHFDVLYRNCGYFLLCVSPLSACAESNLDIPCDEAQVLVLCHQQVSLLPAILLDILIVREQHFGRLHLSLSLLCSLGRRLEGYGGTRVVIHRIGGLWLCLRSISFDLGRIWSRLEIQYCHFHTQRGFDWSYW